MVLVCVRAVHVVSETPARHRVWRALAGGPLLPLPLWFAPLAGPLEGWWIRDDGDEAASDAPSPASEAVMAVVETQLKRVKRGAPLRTGALR